MKHLFNIDEVVPHSGTMSLLSEVLDHGDDWIEVGVHITPDSLFCEARGVPGWVGVEYMAQAIGAHAGVQERLQGREPAIGFLVGTRRYRCETPFFSVGQSLHVRVEHSFQADNGLRVFNCEINADGVCIASASLNVFQPDDVQNYVNGES